MGVRLVALAWSGGKDSSLALAALRADPAVEVVALVTTMTADFDRISMHGVRRTVLEAQVAALGLPLVEATIPAAADNRVYEAAFAAALAAASLMGSLPTRSTDPSAADPVLKSVGKGVAAAVQAPRNTNGVVTCLGEQRGQYELGDRGIGRP